jgi:hypothetical protein
VKHFARVSCLSTRTDQSQRVGNNSDKAAADSYRAAGRPETETNAVPGQPGPPLGSTCLVPDDLKLIAERWGTTYADNLISDRRWPRCNQNVAIAAVEAIVRTAIIDVAAILSAGEDFKPHIKMMSAATWCAFQSSMPNRKGRSSAPIA